jgi:hypothetical protein
LGGPEHDFTNRNTSFMTWNLMHSEWNADCWPGTDNPEHPECDGGA